MSRRDVTKAELRRGYDRRTCPDCSGEYWYPFIRCTGEDTVERDLGSNDGVVEFIRECPHEGRGPQ